MNVLIQPARALSGTVRVPGDKSVSHRALLFSALAHGESRLTNLGPGGDVRSTRRVLEALGVSITDGGGIVRVLGAGFEGLHSPQEPLDCGNSGTTLRVLMGVLAGCPFGATLTGDDSLSRRPMERIAVPLRQMGATVSTDSGHAPVYVAGGALTGIDYTLPVASAQLKTAVLLAGLQAEGTTRVIEGELSRDHTERMLRHMGADLTSEGLSVSVRRSPLRALGDFAVPGDISSAAFWIAAGLLVRGAGLRIEGVLLNPSRTGILDIVRLMGGHVRELAQDGQSGPVRFEPTGDLEARHSVLRAHDIAGSATLRAIDEIPILAVLATQAEGRTVIANAEELRVKESDRLAVMARILTAMGASVSERPDGLIIDGPTPLHGADIDAELDHRIAMATAIAALVADGPTRIRGADAAAVSYPAFFQTLDEVAGAGTVSVE